MTQQPVLKRFGMENRTPGREMPSVIEGRYRLESQIGYGAFGKVFRARDSVTGDTVAVKIFEERLEETGYLQELGLLFSDEHPLLVQTLSFGYAAGRKYLVYEFVRGGSLRDLLIRQPRVEVMHALLMIRDVCEALAFAHSRRVVHRDLKPENLLLTEVDWPCRTKLCDFGLSTRFRPGDRISSYFGSPAYMAPEQFGQSYDHRVDIYAAGVILYEMVFGRRPHAGDAVSLRHAHTHVEPPMPQEGPASLIALLTRMMAKDPEARYAQAADVLVEIDACIAELQQASDALVSVPVFESVAISSRWSMRVPMPCVAWMPTAHQGLLLSLRDHIVAVSADGSTRSLVDTQVPVLEFVEFGQPDTLFAWISGSDIWVWDRGEVRLLEGGVEVPAGARRVLLSPDGRHVLVACATHVDLATTETGEVVWRAEVATYGPPPECCFSEDGQRVWIASESPRTQLVCLSLEGDRVSRTAGPGSDSVLQAGNDGSLVVGSRGKRALQRLNVEGFVTQSLELGASLSELHPVDDRLLAVWSTRHVELIDRTTLASYAMVARPDESEVLLAAGTALYTLELEPESVVVRRFELERTS